MTEFNVGDRVMVRIDPLVSYSGQKGRIDRKRNSTHYTISVVLDGDNSGFWFAPGELIHLVESLGVELAVQGSDLSEFAGKVRYRTNKIADLLIAKNEAYGDSALNPVRVFSKAEPVEQIKVRIDDKISRLQRGTDAGEDTVTDLIGYLILLQIAEDSE